MLRRFRPVNWDLGASLSVGFCRVLHTANKIIVYNTGMSTSLHCKKYELISSSSHVSISDKSVAAVHSVIFNYGAFLFVIKLFCFFHMMTYIFPLLMSNLFESLETDARRPLFGKVVFVLATHCFTSVQISSAG